MTSSQSANTPRANPPIRHTPRQVAVPLSVRYEDAVSLLGERQIAVLRLLGRMEVLATEWIGTMVYPDMTMRQCHRHLLDLHKQGYVWRDRTTMAQIDRTTTSARQKRVPPPRAPYVYSLSPEGRAYLSSVDAEPNNETLEALRTRDRRSPKPEKHDLLVAGWCISVLHEARKCPMLESVVCQVEYVSARDEQGKERQRFDALLILRLNPKQRTYTRPGWAIPWHDGTPASAECRTLRIALEVDRGTEQLSRLFDKGLMYHQLTEQKVYERNLGGDPLTVFLVPAGLRSAQIATEWRDAWPNGPGIISTPKASNHAERGALWGQYLTLKDNPAKPVTIPELIGITLSTWENLTKDWTPLVGSERR